MISQGGSELGILFRRNPANPSTTPAGLLILDHNLSPVEILSM